MRTGYIPNEVGEFVAAEAAEHSVVLPELHVSENLETRLRRHGRTLEISNIDLLRGTISAEFEKPISLYIDPTAKESRETEPALRWAPSGVIDMAINPRPTVADAVQRQLNTGLWLGLLVGEKLVEKKDHMYEAQRDRRMKIAWWAEMWGAGIAAGYSNEVLSWANIIQTTPSWETAEGAIQVAVMAGVYAIERLRHPKGVDYIARRHRHEAEELAAAHPVLSYGFATASSHLS